MGTETSKRQTYKLTQEKTAGIFDAHVPSELNLLKVQKSLDHPERSPKEEDTDETDLVSQKPKLKCHEQH